MTFSCILLYLLLNWICFADAKISKSNVILEDNKYNEIVIAINPHVPESNDLIDSIKESWREASNILFTATKQRAYIGEVTILVPSNWINYKTTATVSDGETYDKADVIIAKPNPSYGDAPYTLQYGGCGSPGSYIHFTPNYFLDEHMVTNFGKRGKAIVHEWAHYRWGVFDETSEVNPFYDDVDGNSLSDDNTGQKLNSATQCPKDFRVCCVESTDEECRLGRSSCQIENGLYTEDCICYPGNSDVVYNTSLMSYQYHEEIVEFCDETNHNMNAPNQQNRLCGLRSVWDVIEESVDFQGNKNPPTEASNKVDPIFSVKIAQASQRFVLVLDVSGSMAEIDGTSGETRFDQMQKAANYFIVNSAPPGSYVGIIEFDRSARNNSGLVKVETLNSRENLARKLPKNVGESCSVCTCIGCGLKMGIQMLEAGGANAAAGQLLVMTDGLETSGSTILIADVADDIKSKKIVIQTLFVYISENQELADLSIESGGSWFFAGEDNLLALLDAYDQMAEVTDGDDTKKTFQILSESYRLESSESSFINNIIIDETIGRNTVFTYTWSYGDIAPSVLLTPPYGNCFYTNDKSMTANPCPDVHSINVDYKTLRFGLDNTAYGTWASYVQKPDSNSQTITVVVTSMAASDEVEPIIVESILSFERGQPLVYAKVSQGLNPVLGATVIATVVKPDGENSSPIQLWDRGAEPDVRINDGIYSRFLTGFSDTGKYSVKVKVQSDFLGYDTSSVVRLSTAAYNPGYVNENGTIIPNPDGPTLLPKNTTFGISAESLGNFTRQISSGSFDYVPPSGGGSHADVLAPSKVMDLKATQKNFTDYTQGVVLVFTSPGDDFDSGKASEYDIRYTMRDVNELLTNYETCPKIDDASVLEGNLSNPSEAGSTQTIVVQTPNVTNENVTTISFGYAVKAIDESGNVGEISNIAISNYYFEPPVFAVPTTTSSPSTAAYLSTSANLTDDTITSSISTTSPDAKTVVVTSSVLSSTTNTSKQNLYIGIGTLLLILTASLASAVMQN
uniref:calcium-activated chloride channel regulator 1-like isoform X1 n=1 Tax=Styela clava TaxID=7725 RepID=UPI00193AC2AF|nr:calcium-activated chloride channel regulator 1-like isoform X1 [Styela clava]